MWMLAVSERASFATASFLALLHRAEALGRKLLVGVVDEEGDVTHYRAQLREMRGGLPGVAPEGPEIGGWAFDDRVVTFELGSADALAPPGHLGRRLGGAHQLSLIEAVWLARAGRLRLRDATTGEPLPIGDLVTRARAGQPDFDLRLRVYSDLRERGLVAKTGFKYGTHFRAYEEDPEGHHARFLVHAVPRDHETSWPELSRAVRLAHGVRKEMVFGAAGEQGVEYLKVRRVRP
jgi:tRNA-intron endonuclease